MSILTKLRNFLASALFLALASSADAVVLCNNAWFNTATSGTGTITSSGAVSGAQTMLACGLTDGQVTRYRVFDGAAWEVGFGTVGGTSTTLTRTVLESSNADAAISLSGTATVIIVPLNSELPSESTPIDSTLVPTADYFLVMEGGSVLERAIVSTQLTENFCVAFSDDIGTAITTGTAKVTFRMPYAFTLTGIRASLTGSSSSGAPIFDVNEAGTSIMTTNKLLIDVSELTSVTAATAATLTDTSLADDASMTVDVDTAGTGADGGKMCLIGYKT